MSDDEIERFMGAIEDLDKPSPAEELATSFDAWYQLNRLLAADPTRVPPEQMALMWDKLIEAHEIWANSR